ncbi:MAG: winged helix-turn-helix domain-containing protein [Tannerella sp.]|nr:winged helix-turn-helix domain-containing protein [Tannerella sp.]
MRKSRLFLFLFLGTVSILILQGIWLHYVYRLTRFQLMVEIREAFGQAYRKEQTYRIPVVDIINPGAVTIESCGAEEVQIIRKCPEPDTIVYSNSSGHSIESFINNVFVDLREHIVPMNIYCLADLFAGMLYERDIPIYFVIERFDVLSGETLDSSLLPDKMQPEMNPETTIVLPVSEKESLRAILQWSSGVVLSRMTGCLAVTAGMVLSAVFCLYFLYREKRAGPDVRATASAEIPAGSVRDKEDLHETNRLNHIFHIAQYTFDPAKNELQGFGEVLQLNKKENTILYTLCMQCGNVVERSRLLEENWGNNGILYSRSLDTYITTLRKYLKKDPSVQIVTIKGVGYKLVW